VNSCAPWNRPGSAAAQTEDDTDCGPVPAEFKVGVVDGYDAWRV
jgi:hypothetical protein